MANKQRLFCLDFESTLVPEFWPAAARVLGIDGLKITTQEYPSFPDLMNKRIKILNEHNVKLPDLIKIADGEQPLEGAREFIERLKAHSPRIMIISDFAEELAAPMINKFGGLTFFGHRFVTFPDGTFSHYDFRQDNPKQKVVSAMQLLEFDIYAAGDSYNDITMLESADKSFFFQSPEKIQNEFPQFQNTNSYDELFDWLTAE